MQELTQHGMARLQQNLIDVIKEAQAKVGYRKEAIRLYYPLRTINHFFDGSYTPEQMEEMLGGLENYTKEALGGVTVTRKDERFCFAIPEEGVTPVSYTHLYGTSLYREDGGGQRYSGSSKLSVNPDCTWNYDGTGADIPLMENHRCRVQYRIRGSEKYDCKASDSSFDTTGQTIYIDGGYTILTLQSQRDAFGATGTRFVSDVIGFCPDQIRSGQEPFLLSRKLYRIS